nr:dipeptidyl peptidase 4-like [Dermatophagoides farinae]
MGNILLIMHNNDIYWLNMEASIAPLRRITMDGSISDSIYNGINDNIYRDFIFEKPTSLWWSPSANRHYHLCYLQVNNSQVPLSNVVIYDDNDGYSTNHYRYSTLNSSIGTANLWIIRINAQTNEYEQAIRVQPPDRLNQWPHYVVHVNWLSNDQLIVLWSLRDQRRTILGSCIERNNWKCDELVTLRNWLRMNHVPNSIMPASAKHLDESSLATGINSELLFCGQTPENGVKTFYQLYSFNVKTKVINSYLNVAERYTEQRQHYQIIELLGYNNHSKSVFFVGQSLNQSSNDEGEKVISEQDMRINLFVFNLEHSLVHCITCQLIKCYQAKHLNNQSVCIDLANSATINENDADEESCIFQHVYFSPSSEYAIVSCLVGIVPKIYLVKFGDQPDLVENIMLFDDNSELESRVQSKIMPNVENFIFTRENDNLIKYFRIKLLTPQNFDHEEIGKYSMLLEMYPSRHRYHYLPKTTINSQGTFHKRIYPDLEWAVHMVTEHDFIYAWLDGQFYQDGNHSLHELSFEELLVDYSTLIDFIVTNMTFVNIAQTCLIGHNVGGYFVLNSLSTTSIECGIAISSFVDWNTINSFLAEQYIDVDKVRSNDLQYLLKMTLNWKMLENKNLLIIHGTSNEMFPISQSMRLMKSLTLEEQNRYIKFHQNPSHDDMDEMNWTSHHFMELYVDHGNSFDTLIEHFYRKIEFFLFQWIIV